MVTEFEWGHFLLRVRRHKVGYTNVYFNITHIIFPLDYSALQLLFSSSRQIAREKNTHLSVKCVNGDQLQSPGISELYYSAPFLLCVIRFCSNLRCFNQLASIAEQYLIKLKLKSSFSFGVYICLIVIQTHYLQLHVCVILSTIICKCAGSMTPGALWLIPYMGRDIYSWPNSVNKITEHYAADAICAHLFASPHSNYITQQQVRLSVVIRHTESRDMCGLTLPYVSRTRSSIAQYIKQDNDGRRTAGESQPGIVNKTVKTVFYLQKWCRLF